MHTDYCQVVSLAAPLQGVPSSLTLRPPRCAWSEPRRLHLGRFGQDLFHKALASTLALDTYVLYYVLPLVFPLGWDPDSHSFVVVFWFTLSPHSPLQADPFCVWSLPLPLLHLPLPPPLLFLASLFCFSSSVLPSLGMTSSSPGALQTERNVAAESPSQMHVIERKLSDTVSYLFPLPGRTNKYWR